MKKQYSGSKVLFITFLGMMIVSLTCLLICGSYALYSTQEEILYCSNAVVNLSFSGISHIMDDLTAFSDNLYASDPDFRTLAMDPQTVPSEKLIQVRYELRKEIHNRISANTGILLFDLARDWQHYEWGNDVWQGAVSKETVRSAAGIREFWETKENPELLGWQVLTIGEKSFLLQAKRFHDLIICTAVDITSFAVSNQKEMGNTTRCAFITYDSILTGNEYAEENGITLEDMLSSVQEPQSVKGHILQTRMNEDAVFGICCMNSMDSFWGSWRNYAILLLVTVVIICIASFIIYRMVRKMLIYPMYKIGEISTQIQNGSLEIQRTSERLQEIDEIQNALITLVEQKVTLETEKAQQKSMKEHALLQYYQLQTRSHFMLNCLKSIYNLAAHGEREQTLRLVTRFSNHIRYIFHDSLTFVTVRAELEEVDDYFEIVQQERTDHILLSKSIAPELLDYPIPPLLIQTFVENFQKHNIQGDKVLRFVIKIDHLKMDGRKYVRIRLSDNGIGYSEEALSHMQQTDGDFAQFHVGIQNLCRRMDILYRKEQKIAFFNLPNGGACSVFYLPADEYLADYDNSDDDEFDESDE